MSEEIEAGLSREALIKVATHLFPPLRPKDFGVSIREMKNATGLKNDETISKRLLDSGLVGVLMIDPSNNSSQCHIYAPREDAEPYKEWIVKE